MPRDQSWGFFRGGFSALCWFTGASFGLLGSFFLSASFAGPLASTPAREPAYCDPKEFDEKEIFLGEGLKLEESGLARIHAFRVGKVTLVGAGVGNSKASALVDFARQYTAQASPSPSVSKVPDASNSLGLPSLTSLKDKKYCTWYLNHPRDAEDLKRIEAVKFFNYLDIQHNPLYLSEDLAEKEFMEALQKTFDQGRSNFLSCAVEQHYIALGCNGMMHRGPTVFGMLLAFSGCLPRHALEIANQTWGLNGVRWKVRLAVIKKAYELGTQHKDSRNRLMNLFLGI